jgi:gluconolactonase
MGFEINDPYISGSIKLQIIMMKKIIKFLVIPAIIACTISCDPGKKKIVERNYKTIGAIESYSAKFDSIVKPSAVIEVLASGFEWTEGPVWIKPGNYLLFSDIPLNRIYKWPDEDSVSVYLEPSGYTGKVKRGGEAGSNGLLLDPDGRLVLCQHGDRRMARMDAALDKPASVFVTLAGDFQGKRFNSPNDGVYNRAGDLYFTDPPYGLEKLMEDSSKELNFQGVYKLSKEGKLDLLTDELSRPNGIGLSPDEKTLYVANSDPERAIWMAYDINEKGQIGNGRVFYDATVHAKTLPGLPDGLKVHSKGYIFATGPGGVWVFAPDGSRLGMIKTTQATANCAFNGDESVLYITADMYLLRVKLK